jgi:hypothetical protein
VTRTASAPRSQGAAPFRGARDRKAQLRFFVFFITLGLELSDTKVYEPYIRALLELLRNTAEQLFSNRELYRSVQLRLQRGDPSCSMTRRQITCYITDYAILEHWWP